MIRRSKGSVAGGIGSRKGRGPTKWGGPQAIEPLLCVGPIYIVADEMGNRLFAPLIEPAEVFAVPHHGVLWLEDPVVLVWEDEQS